MKDSFVDKLKKRKIWKTVVGFPAAAFVILQAVDFFITKYGLNPKALTFTLILLCGGFLISIIWNWLHGEDGRQEYTRNEEPGRPNWTGLRQKRAIFSRLHACRESYWYVFSYQVRVLGRSILLEVRQHSLSL